MWVFQFSQPHTNILSEAVDEIQRASYPIVWQLHTSNEGSAEPTKIKAIKRTAIGLRHTHTHTLPQTHKHTPKEPKQRARGRKVKEYVSVWYYTEFTVRAEASVENRNQTWPFRSVYLICLAFNLAWLILFVVGIWITKTFVVLYGPRIQSEPESVWSTV